MSQENLIANDVVRLKDGTLAYYAGYIPARGHFIRDVKGDTHLLPNHDKPLFVSREETKPPQVDIPQVLHHRLSHHSPTSFPHDDTY